MILDLLFDGVRRGIDRLNYEKERAKKVLPVLLRLGLSELEELYTRFRTWRETCDHTVSSYSGPRSGRPKRKRKKKVKPLKT
jgi:hypothetical protein